METKDDDRPLIDREAPEAAVELVADGDGTGLVGSRRLEPEDRDRASLATTRPEFVGHRPHQEAPDPRVEPAGIAQGRKVPPAADERLLDGILGAVRVPQHEAGDGVEAVDHGRGDQVERVSIAAPGAGHAIDLLGRHGTLRPGS